MAAQPPTFSVLIAAYQASAFVADAVGSALQQEPVPHEVIVGDDGSTDDLAGALAPFGAAVRVVRIDHAGEAAAKNAAAAAATGTFLAFLDADDRYLPGRLAAMAALLERDPSLDIVTTDAHLVHEGTVVDRCYNDGNPFAHENQRSEILRRNFVFGLTAVRRSRFEEVGGFDASIAYTTDWELWIRMVLTGSRIGLVPEALAEYRLHPDSMSAKRAAMAHGRLATLRRVASRDDLTDDDRRIVRETIRTTSAMAAREDLRVTLDEGATAQTRKRARQVATGRTQPLRERAKAVATFVAPRRAAASWQRRRAGTFVTVGDRKLPR